MKFSLYPIVFYGQKLLQKALYKISEKYRINLVSFFEFMEDKDYVIIKLDSPKMHPNFPIDYKVGTDVDIIIFEKDLDIVKSRIIEFNKTKAFNCRILSHKNGTKIRYEFFNFLNLEFDLQFVRNNNFYKDCIIQSTKINAIKIPNISHEIVLRALEYQIKPRKTYHLEYILKHKDHIDFQLLTNNGVDSSTIQKIKNS